MTFGSLFAGIGGLDLGLERAGMECKWQVEIDDYAKRVLQKHWPNVRRWDDVTTFKPTGKKWKVDLICGGFPCQDISTAGKRAGLHGDRSGLFFEAIRVVELLRPRWLLLENVAGLLARGLDEVLATLAEVGFDAEWHCLQAADFGAPHIRDRIFIIAHADRKRSAAGATDSPAREKGIPAIFDDYCSDITNTNRRPNCSDTPPTRPKKGQQLRGKISRIRTGSDWWATEPDVGRVANGIPARVDRLRGIGNAVVPQIAEWLGRQIIEMSPDS